MRKLILENKTGFISVLPFEIFECNQRILFYSSDFTNTISEGRPLKFNLPLGVYWYNGSFSKLVEPVKTRDIQLPQRQRNYKQRKYKIIFEKNPNKCSIYYDRGVIIFDNMFKNYPLFMKYGIYFHELGHHFYSSEQYADLYAVKKMLDYGFNPSQIGRVFLFTLSEKSLWRIENIIEMLTKNKG